LNGHPVQTQVSVLGLEQKKQGMWIDEIPPERVKFAPAESLHFIRSFHVQLQLAPRAGSADECGLGQIGMAVLTVWLSRHWIVRGHMHSTHCALCYLRSIRFYAMLWKAA